MRDFTRLYFELDQTTRTAEKLAALRRYLASAAPLDAAWAVYVLSDRKIAKAISSRRFRQWASEESGQPPWMVDVCHQQVGDLSETISLLVPTADPPGDPPPLHELVAQVIQPLNQMPEDQQRRVITGMWKRLTQQQCLVFHKLLGGEFRIGVSRQMLVLALAEMAGVTPAVIAHRLSGTWKPDENTMQRLLAADTGDAGASMLPYPFMLAHALLNPLETLGDIHDWLLEWKWDGARAQIIRRSGQTTIWSRGDELITPAFPEIAHAAAALPDGTVLDGEIIAWENGSVIPAAFQRLQRRLNRRTVEPTFWPETPVVFMAFDTLEHQRRDVRSEPLRRRREMLGDCMAAVADDPMLMQSPAVDVHTWPDAQSHVQSARERGVEGLMLKRLDSSYEPGRPTGLWWKLKIAPFTLDCVLIAAEPGRGKRAGLLTAYTFGVWDQGELVPIARAYSGLDDAEIREMDRFIRAHTLSRHGPVHVVEPVRVIEIAFEAIARSTRHKSGVAVRFPRMLRLRFDRTPESADTLERVHALLAASEAIR